MSTLKPFIKIRHKNRTFEGVLIYIVSLFILSIRNPFLAYDGQTYVQILSYTKAYSDEYGFFFYNQLVHNFFGINNGGYLIVTSGVILSIFFIAFYRLGLRDVRVIFLLSSPSVILLSINGIRQGFALAILSLIFSFNSKFAWIVILIISSQFHKGSLIIGLFGLSLLVFRKYYFNSRSLFIVLPLTAFLLGYAMLPYIMLVDKVRFFSEMNFNPENTYVIRLLAYLVLYIFLVFKIFRSRVILMSDYFVLSTISLVLLFNNIPYFSSRIAYFLEIFLLFSVLLRAPANSIFNRVFYFIIGITFSILVYQFPSIQVQMF